MNTHDESTAAKASGRAVAPFSTSNLVIPVKDTAVSTYKAIHAIMLDEIELGKSLVGFLASSANVVMKSNPR